MFDFNELTYIHQNIGSTRHLHQSMVRLLANIHLSEMQTFWIQRYIDLTIVAVQYDIKEGTDPRGYEILDPDAYLGASIVRATIHAYYFALNIKTSLWTVTPQSRWKHLNAS